MLNFVFLEMLSPDQERIRSILYETITSICKNGLHFDSELRVDAIIGVTLDQHEVFLITVNEIIGHGEPPGCLMKKRTVSDQFGIKTENSSHRLHASACGLSRTSTLMKSNDLDTGVSRHSSTSSEFERSSKVKDCRSHSVSVDGATTDSLHGLQAGGCGNGSDNPEETLACRVSVNLDESCSEDQAENSSVSRIPTSSHEAGVEGIRAADDSVAADIASNSSTKDDDDDDNDNDPVIFIKQEQNLPDDNFSRSSAGHRQLSSHGYIYNSSASGAFRSPITGKEPGYFSNRPHVSYN